ncbi:hypothetical protein [Serratia fonticola]|uniref:hypothetical protein n=1 Tax=Serratia fonticola TaxID=47917 RepID=UPI0034C66D6B
MNWLTSLRIAVLLGVVVYSGFLAINGKMLSTRLESAKQQLREQQRSLAQQAGLIATLQTQDAQNRVLMAEQQRQEQLIRQQATDNERKYREAIEDDECAKRDMPGAVIDILQ